MPDMLVRLYDLPASAGYYTRASAAGVRVRRLDAWDRFALQRFIEKHFPGTWAAEADFAFTQGHPISGFLALYRGKITGFAVYDTSRRGFFGPTGVREDIRGNDVGAALLFRCLEAMREAGYGYAIIGGVGPAEFYEKVCGATIIPGSERSIYGDLYDEMRERSVRQT